MTKINLEIVLNVTDMASPDLTAIANQITFPITSVLPLQTPTPPPPPPTPNPNPQPIPIPSYSPPTPNPPTPTLNSPTPTPSPPAYTPALHPTRHPFDPNDDGENFLDNDSLQSFFNIASGILFTGLSFVINPAEGARAFLQNAAVGYSSSRAFNRGWEYLDARSDASYEGRKIGINYLDPFAEPLLFPGSGRTELYRQIEELIQEESVQTPHELELTTRALSIQNFIDDPANDLAETPMIELMRDGSPQEIEYYSGWRLFREIALGDPTASEFWSETAPSFFQHMPPEVMPGYRLDPEYVEYLQAVPTDYHYGTPTFFGGAIAESDNVFIQEALDYLSQGMPHMNSSDIEEFKSWVDQSADSTSSLTEATSSLSSAGEGLYDNLHRNLDLLGLHSNEAGHLRAVWDETTNLFNESTSTFEALSQSSGDLVHETANLNNSLFSIQSLDLGNFAAVMGESFVAAEGQINSVGQATWDLESQLSILGAGESTTAAAESITGFHAQSAPRLSDLSSLAGMLSGHLLAIPANVNSSVNVDFNISGDVERALSLGIPLGLQRAIDPELRASGGPLSDVTLVGEEGPEFIINGIVVPTRETRKLMSLGLSAQRSYRFGGPLYSDRFSTHSVDADNFDPFNVEQGQRIRDFRRALTPIESAEQSRLYDDPVSRESSAQGQIESLVNLSLAVEGSLRDTVSDSTNETNNQSFRELAQRMETSNSEVAGLMRQMIMETRRLKFYFRDAVRLMSD